jgi:hypothetical protein
VDAGHGSPASGRHDRRPSRRRPRRGRVGDPRRRERPRCVRGPRGGAPVPPSAVEPPPRAAPDTSSHGPQFLGGLAGGLLSSRGTRAR